jgi:hypothetical protein
MMRARESWSAATRAAISGSGEALSSARATAPCMAASPRTARRNSSHTGNASGATSRPSSGESIVMKPRSLPSGGNQPQTTCVRSPIAVPARHTTTVKDTIPIGSISSR